MAYQFLDESGLNIILNKIKNIFVPRERKIAELDLKDDITAEELAAELNEYIGGKDGKSAYEIAVDEGFVGSERRWLESLKGANTYQLAQEQGFEGSEADWLESLKGQSATHQWEGTVLTITSASGTSSSDLKGEKGTSVTDGMLVEDDEAGNVAMTWFDYEDGNEVEY